MTKVDPLNAKRYPQGIFPMLHVEGAEAAVEFYKHVFGATEGLRIHFGDGRIAHCDLWLRGSVFLVSDASPDLGMAGPKEFGGSPVHLSVYVEDVDELFERAVAKGATVVHPVELHFYGDRSGKFDDPFGHRWSVTTHVEDVPSEEIVRRSAEALKEGVPWQTSA